MVVGGATGVIVVIVAVVAVLVMGFSRRWG